RLARAQPARSAARPGRRGPALRRHAQRAARRAHALPPRHHAVAVALVPQRAVASQDARRARLPERTPGPERSPRRARRPRRDESVPLPAALPRVERADAAPVSGPPARRGGPLAAAPRRSLACPGRPPPRLLPPHPLPPPLPPP